MSITVLKYLNEHQDGEFHSVDQILKDLSDEEKGLVLMELSEKLFIDAKPYYEIGGFFGWTTNVSSEVTFEAIILPEGINYLNSNHT
ncbi:MAG: hypothetical protein GQ564_08260 [Bacteroidales bacterium]|nr:hypothetical protein [Bacteroidales bacterium]